MGMAAEHGHAFVGMALHCCVKHVSDGFAGKKREPLRVGRPPCIPGRLPERRNMGKHHNVIGGFQGLGQDLPEMSRGLIPELVKLEKAISLRETGELVNQVKVIEVHG